jgi:hypothetical protein
MTPYTRVDSFELRASWLGSKRTLDDKITKITSESFALVKVVFKLLPNEYFTHLLKHRPTQVYSSSVRVGSFGAPVVGSGNADTEKFKKYDAQGRKTYKGHQGRQASLREREEDGM